MTESAVIEENISMKIADFGVTPVYDEKEIYESLLPLDGANVLELGCGKAENTVPLPRAARLPTS